MKPSSSSRSLGVCINAMLWRCLFMWMILCSSPFDSSSLSCIGCFALNRLEFVGSKFFDSETSREVKLRGIDYYPRPNVGPLATGSSVDFFTNQYRHIWQRDIPILKSLGVNAIRIYSVDPPPLFQNTHASNRHHYENDKRRRRRQTTNAKQLVEMPHAAFMCALEAAGIYVLVELATAECAVTRDEAPKCFSPKLLWRGQAIINEFIRYPNTLAFSTGNEVNHFAPPHYPQWNAPCQKRFLQTQRRFLTQCATKQINQQQFKNNKNSTLSLSSLPPIGLVLADSDRDLNAFYYMCNEDADNHHFALPQWYGLNAYLFCDGNVTSYNDATGLVKLAKDFQRYQLSIPAILTEFGCLSQTFATQNGFQAQRDFRQASWLYQTTAHNSSGDASIHPLLGDVFVGGFVFEYSTELINAQAGSPWPFKTFGTQNYGLGYMSPQHCNDVDVPCRYVRFPNFFQLRNIYQSVAAQSTLWVTKKQYMRQLKQQWGPQKTRGEKTRSCPPSFPKLSQFQWETDQVQDLDCPSVWNFKCPANISDLLFSPNVAPLRLHRSSARTMAINNKKNTNPHYYMMLILLGAMVLCLVFVVWLIAAWQKGNNRHSIALFIDKEHYHKPLMERGPPSYQTMDTESSQNGDEEGEVVITGNHIRQNKS